MRLSTLSQHPKVPVSCLYFTFGSKKKEYHWLLVLPPQLIIAHEADVTFGRPNLNHLLWPYSLFSIPSSLSLTSFFLFFSMFWNLDNSFSCSALMRFASSRKRFVCSCSNRSIVCFCCFSRFSISWSYCRFLIC